MKMLFFKLSKARHYLLTNYIQMVVPYSQGRVTGLENWYHLIFTCPCFQIRRYEPLLIYYQTDTEEEGIILYV